MGKLRHIKDKWLVQGHTAIKTFRIEKLGFPHKITGLFDFQKSDMSKIKLIYIPRDFVLFSIPIFYSCIGCQVKAKLKEDSWHQEGSIIDKKIGDEFWKSSPITFFWWGYLARRIRLIFGTFPLNSTPHPPPHNIDKIATLLKQQELLGFLLLFCQVKRCEERLDGKERKVQVKGKNNRLEIKTMVCTWRKSNKINNQKLA